MLVKDARELLANSIVQTLSQKRYQSIDSISVQSIIDTANFSRPTFYKYFRDKYDLINWVFYIQAETVFEPVYYKTNTGSLFLGILQIIHKNPAFYRNIIRTESPNGFPEYLYFYFCFNFTRLVLKKWDVTDYPSLAFLDKIFAEEKDAETFYAITYNARGCADSIVNWIKKGYKIEPEKMSEIIKYNISASLRSIMEDYYI